MERDDLSGNPTNGDENGESQVPERIIIQDPFAFLVDSMLRIEKSRVATQVRQSHLKLQNKVDPETNELLEKLVEVEKYLDGRIGRLIEAHPVWPWASRVKGVGRENLAKIVGLMDIEKVSKVSSIWKFAGFHVVDGKAPKPKLGEKLEYNKQLRSMCWRLAGAILKAGIRQYCVKCGEQRPAKVQGIEPICQCGGREFESKPETRFAEYYFRQKNSYEARYRKQGIKIVPTAQLPKEKGKVYEPPDMISEGHVHNQALRKMIKLFLSCLVVFWKDELQQPLRPLYVMEKLGHQDLITPEEMTDRPAKVKTTRRRNSAAAAAA